jgi:hypothetical protein
MLSRMIAALLVVVAVSSVSLGFEVSAVIRKVDVEKGILVVFGGGQERTVPVAKDAKFLDEKGKDLEGGLAAKEIKEGAAVTLTVERDGNTPTIKGIRLGGQQGNVGGPKGNAGGQASVGKPSVGFKPLSEMTAQDKYKGEEGGLYGGGKNDPLASHRAAAQKETAKIEPLDSEGKPAPDGKIVLVSISMSNATQEFSRFKQIADEDADKSPRLTIVDCAQGGQAMAQWVSPDARAWAEADRRIAAADVSAKQVQVAWVKLANVAPNGELAEHGKKLQNDTMIVVQNAKKRFPNLRIAYLGSRIYGGYADGRLNPEPYAYEGAFATRWLIQDQIKGTSDLNYDAERGEVKAPLLLWGPYFWGDGTTPRSSDGLIWERQDLVGDGTHPSQSGRQKVADMLLKFFKTDEMAKAWFVKR